MKWIDRINEAEKSGHFTAEDRSLVGSFKTCAVSEWSFTVDKENIPTNNYIKGLGMNFMRAVNFDSVNEAHTIYNEIGQLAR